MRNKMKVKKIRIRRVKENWDVYEQRTKIKVSFDLRDIGNMLIIQNNGQNKTEMDRHVLHEMNQNILFKIEKKKHKLFIGGIVAMLSDYDGDYGGEKDGWVPVKSLGKYLDTLKCRVDIEEIIKFVSIYSKSCIGYK